MAKKKAKKAAKAKKRGTVEKDYHVKMRELMNAIDECVLRNFQKESFARVYNTIHLAYAPMGESIGEEACADEKGATALEKEHA